MLISTILVSSTFGLAAPIAAAEPRYAPTRVVVDIDPLIEQSPAEGDDMRRLERINADRTAAKVAEQVEDALEQHGVPVVHANAVATVAVRLEWKVYLESHYVAKLGGRNGDGAMTTVTLECELCDETKLAAAVVERIPEILPALQEAATAPSDVAPTEGDPPPEGETTLPPETEPPPDVPKIGAAGWVGIGTGVVGIGGIVVGAVSLGRGRQVSLGADVVQQRIDDYRPAGIAFVAAGSALLVTGAVLVALDQTVLAKRRAERARRIGVGPQALPLGGGIAVTGRF